MILVVLFCDYFYSFGVDVDADKVISFFSNRDYHVRPSARILLGHLFIQQLS